MCDSNFQWHYATRAMKQDAYHNRVGGNSCEYSVRQPARRFAGTKRKQCVPAFSGDTGGRVCGEAAVAGAYCS